VIDPRLVSAGLSPNISVVERFVLGFLDPASGLSDETLTQLREETQDLVDDARLTPLEFEDLAVESFVKDAVLVGVVDVLEECGADEWTRSQVEDINRFDRVTGARAAAQKLRRIHAEVETVIEKAACHHAAQSCDALAESPVPSSATREAFRDSMHTAATMRAGCSVSSSSVATPSGRCATCAAPSPLPSRTHGPHSGS
jgi:hypothetical protein